MTTFTLMLSSLTWIPGGGAPYAASSLSALVVWAYVQNAVSFVANTLLTDGTLDGFRRVRALGDLHSPRLLAVSLLGTPGSLPRRLY